MLKTTKTNERYQHESDHVLIWALEPKRKAIDVKKFNVNKILELQNVDEHD